MRHSICSSVRPLGALALFLACQGESPSLGQGAEVSHRLGQASPRPVDILLVVDNSSSMSAKQGLLADATRSIVERLTQPGCVDELGGQSAIPPGADCPEGLWRQFPAVEDLHVGVITTSLGDLGANDTCNADSPEALKQGMADNAHLLGSLARGRGGAVGSQGFAEWHLGDDREVFQQQLAQWVQEAGHRGCGWEMTQESWFRFLVDPAPYAELHRVACGPGDGSPSCVQPTVDDAGRIVLDEELLAQRADFLRPNSTVGIVLLTDENDCSVQLGPQSYYPLSTEGAMPRASSACADNPDDRCCYSCGTQPPDNCPSDPSCSQPGPGGGAAARLAPGDDALNLRCFDPKRRFGYDMLYPVERYSNALSNRSLCLGRSDLDEAQCPGELVDNPLFSGSRTPQDVFVAGIVGVPWQLISPAGSGALATAESTVSIEYRSASELSSEQWVALIGQPQASPPMPPSSPFMVESPTPRQAVLDGNAINGREWDTTDPVMAGATDLQFACTFELSQPVDCGGNQAPNADYCPCAEGFNDSPLCEEQAGSGVLSPVQYRARAYPGTRHLQVLKPLGERAVIGSICPGSVEDPRRLDHGYRPVVSALVQSMAPSLNAFTQ